MPVTIIRTIRVFANLHDPPVGFDPSPLARTIPGHDSEAQHKTEEGPGSEEARYWGFRTSPSQDRSETATGSPEQIYAHCRPGCLYRACRGHEPTEGMPVTGYASDVHVPPVAGRRAACGFARAVRAREAQADTLAEEILQIADDGSNDTYTDDEGRTHVDYDHISRSKLRVDARKWLASKMAPKKYGDRITNEHTGANGGAIEVKSTVTFVQPKPRGDDE